MKISAFGQSIDVRYEPVSREISAENYFCGQDQFYLNIEGVAKYHLLPRENVVFVEKHVELENDYLINTWLYGTVFAYLLQWHDYLVLHGSAILVNNQAVIFSGDSGAGKSTTAANFINKGYQLLTDDVVALRYRHDGVLELVPGPCKVKLWADALNHLNKDRDGLQQVINKENKFELPVEQNVSTPVPVAQLYELNHSLDDDIKVLALSNAEKMQVLIKNTYRYGMLKPMGKLVKHLQDITQLAGSIEVLKVIRPKNQYLLNELIDTLEGAILSGKMVR